VLGLLCLLATDVAARTAFALDGALVPPIWPASGVLLGALLLAPRQRWLAAAAVAWVAMALPLTVHGWTPVGAAGLAAVHVAEAPGLPGVPQGGGPWPGVWAASWRAGALALVFAAGVVICWRAWQGAPATHGVSRVALAATVAGAAIMAQGIYGNLVPDVVRA